MESPDTEQHPSFWLADGSIVLSVASATRPVSVLFRVHMSVLARQSEVFTDMLSFPKPPHQADSRETYDGLPMVVLHDSAEDWQTLLEVLYNSK